MSPRKASVDVEFKSYVTGFEDSKKKLQVLIDTAKEGASIDTSEKRKRFDDKSAIGKLANKFDVVGKKFLKPLAFLLGGAGVLTGVLSVMKQIVSQSQVYASIVQLVLTPFVMMVNLMLLPVLKWIIPHVMEWLEWTVANKDALGLFGTILSAIGETLIVLASPLNFFKGWIEEIQSIIDTVSNTDMSLGEKFVRVLNDIGDFLTQGSLFNMFGMGWVTDLGTHIRDKLTDAFFYALDEGGSFFNIVGNFFSNFFKSIGEDIYNALRSMVESIPGIGEDLANTIFGYKVSPYENPLLGDKLPSLTPMTSSGPLVGTPSNYELIMMSGNYDASDIKTVSPEITSMFKAKIGSV